MNKISPAKTGARIRRTLLIWLFLFLAIALLMPAIDLMMHVPGKIEIRTVLVFAALGASLWFPMVGLWWFIRWCCGSWQNCRRALLGAAILATAIATFYTEEDWRGEHAWLKYKAELEAKGEVLDWKKYIPPHLPDDQNFFTASTNILLRFVKQQTQAGMDAAAQLPWLRLSFDAAVSNSVVTAEVTVVSSNSNAIPNDADLYLRYDHSVLSLASSNDNFPELSTPLIPALDLKDVPLEKAIEQVAQAAQVSYTLDPKINFMGPKGKPILVTIRWKNITARQALFALLDNFNLVLLENSKTGAGQILPKKGQAYVEPDAAKKINDLISDVLEHCTNGSQGIVLPGVAGFTFFSKSRITIKPARIIVRANEIPGAGEMSGMFSKRRVKATGSNSFQIQGNPMILSAEDYLAASDQFVPAFDEVRAALKRPYAMIPGDYSQSYTMPIPNFITMRALAHTLAQRTQCYLMLGRSEEALHELTLIHDVCRILEKPPTGKPETLVEAMINVAITAVYVATVQDGLRLHVWQEPQLVAIQQQLAGTTLIPFVNEAFREEQAHISDIGSLQHFRQVMTVQLFGYGQNRPAWEIIPDYLDYELMPRGWIYQNIKCAVELEQTMIGCLDESNAQVYPQEVDLHNQAVNKALHSYSPFHYLAAIAIPNINKALQTCAHNQTLANEGQIACALERYRLAHSEYPQTVAALVPQFMEKVPNDIIGGEPLHYHRMDDGNFLLYSLGWNETDDGGTPGSLKDAKRGDWVWQYPAQ